MTSSFAGSRSRPGSSGPGGGSRRRRTALAALGVLAVVVAPALSGCSSGSGGGEEDAGPSTTSTLVPSSSGDSCIDPAGDLDLPVGVTADTPGLDGVDLTQASATVAGDQLDVSITTAGPIDAAPAATYVVAQGEPLGALSFELRMVHGADGWSSTLITWPSSVETRQRLSLTPRVDGSTLTAALPLAGLPPIALALQFGATAQVGDAVVIDDCSSLAAG